MPLIDFMQDIEDAIANGSGPRRAEMLRRVTDLFVDQAPQYSDDEIKVFDDVIMLLVAEIEKSARVMLAGRLATIPNAPPRVINKLAADEEIEVAWPVLAQSGRVSEETLIESAMLRGQQHLLAISRRRDIPVRVTDILVARGERNVLAGVAGNAGAHFSELGYATLVDRSGIDDDLIERIGARADIPRPLFLKLLANASGRVRDKLKEAHPQAAVEEAVRIAADRIQSAVREESSRYQIAQAMVDNLHRSGQLRDGDVEGFAADGQFEETATSLAQLCELPVETIERAMASERAETVLVFVRAAGLSRTTARTILTLCNNGRHGPDEIERALVSFDRLKPATAHELVRFYKLRDEAIFTPKQ